LEKIRKRRLGASVPPARFRSFWDSVAEDAIKNVFISHVHEDDEGLGKTKELLAKNGMTIRDGSINCEKPKQANAHRYIKSEILALRIKWAGTFIT
jgi:MTH538 TIR-like domain (DUF1863)